MTALRQATMSALNESLVLDYVREHGGTSRPAIARNLGLSAATVSRIVTRLIHSGHVTESAQPSDGRGRPAGRIAFNHRAGCIVAVDLGGTKCHGVLADLAGTVLVEDVRPTRANGTPYDTLLGSITTLMGFATTPLVAVVVGVPAIVEPVTGVVLEGPNVRWLDFPLAEELGRALDVPVAVDNDVKLAAMAQAWRGLGKGVPDFATIAIGTGIGAAIVANGELVRGRDNTAGEIGYLIVHPEQLAEPHAHGLGGLERVISGPAIAERARQHLVRDPTAPSRLKPGTVTSEQVIGAALSGDIVANLVVDEVLDALAMALIALTVTADPTLIIIDGGVGRSLEPYLDRLSETLARHLPWVPRLVVSTLGANATVVGAIATALWLDRRRGRPRLPSRKPVAPLASADVG
jgi:glucokinase